MALQHRIKWEIALSSRKRAKISNFLLKALRAAAVAARVQKQQKQFKSESLI